MKENVWIITLKLPSGTQYAFTHYKKTFALVPIENGQVRQASSWDTLAQAEHYLEEQLKIAPTLMKLGPFEFIQVKPTPKYRKKHERL